MHGQNSLVSYLVMGVAIVLIVALRFRRMGRDRPLRLDGLWVLPAIYLAILAVAFAQAPPDITGWALIGIGFVLGGLAGWLRGRAITITVDSGTGTLNQRASPLALILLIVLIAVRYGLRVLARQGSPVHLGATTIVDAFLALAFGLIALQRLEMFLRGRRLLAQAKAKRPNITR
jgi:hypothetical protein